MPERKNSNITSILPYLISGLILRVIWPMDMEWKGDEKALFDLSKSLWDAGRWAVVGIPNSQGIPNFPLSIWVLSLFQGVARTPVGMVRLFQGLNAFALLGFLWGLSKLILNADNEQKRAEGKQILLWGIIALFAMVSIWGLLRVLENTFLS